jgi:hypothetical protein
MKKLLIFCVIQMKNEYIRAWVAGKPGGRECLFTFCACEAAKRAAKKVKKHARLSVARCSRESPFYISE